MEGFDKHYNCGGLHSLGVHYVQKVGREPFLQLIDAFLEDSCKIPLKDDVRIRLSKTPENTDKGLVWAAGVHLLELEEVSLHLL